LVQRRVATGVDGSAAPPMVDEVLRSPGRPLDRDTRAFMEPRFGHDFSQVRVHTDARAAAAAQAVQAQAFTLRHNIVFSAGQYNPNRTEGRRILAHELTHVIQQQSPKANSVPNIQLLERSIRPAGQFADELEETLSGSQFIYPLPDGTTRGDEVVRLLNRSSEFRRMVRFLNRRYVSSSYYREHEEEIEFDERGFIISGRPWVRGRRVITINTEWGAAFFLAADSPDNPWIAVEFTSDLINIDSSHQGVIIGYIEDIAHEAAHAVESFGAGTAPATIMDEIEQVIEEEASVRGTERTVVSETGLHPRTTPTEIWAVERDFLRLDEHRTYIENAFFSATLRRAIDQEHLQSDDVSRIQTEVNHLSITGTRRYLDDPDNFWLRTAIIPSRYGRLLFLRRVIHHSWATFLEDHEPGSEGFDYWREQKLQDHARSLNRIGQAFFGETITYSPRPTPPVRPPSRPFWESFGGL
jgi:hypothetical protein